LILSLKKDTQSKKKKGRRRGGSRLISKGPRKRPRAPQRGIGEKEPRRKGGGGKKRGIDRI